MSLREFIRTHRSDIDEFIKSVSDPVRFNDEERRLWVLNDERLYYWAKALGVKNI